MKMKIKSLLCSVTALILIAVFSIPVFAAGTETTFTVSGIDAAVGEEVRITVRVDNNSGFANGMLKLTFDDSILAYKSYTDESLMTSALSVIGTKEKGAVKYGFVLTDNLTADGALFTLIFDVLPGSEGKTCPLTLTVEELVDAKTDADVPSATVGTSVKIKDKVVFERGDVDGNGKITLADAMYIVEHVAKKSPLTGDRLLPADVDGDGKITLNDANAIILFVARKTDKL